MSNDNPTLSDRSGLGLRTKLALGFAGLLALLLATGVASISLLSRLGGSVDVILRENYRSVLACEQMKEALERMDSGALFALAGHEGQGRTLVVQNRPRFEAALATELGNITLPGEGERAAHLQQLYRAYVPVLHQLVAPEVPLEKRRALYFQRLLPTFQRIKATADEILQLNQQSMVEANDRARALAAAASRSMALLLLAGTAFAGLCVAFLSRAILAPLERLTRAARQIQAGDLELTVPVTSRDELGQLAAAFNAMAGGLRELRETEQAHLLRARRFSQLVLDDLPVAVAAISPDRRVELANRAAVELLGLRPDGPLPERLRAWLAPLLDRIEAGWVGGHKAPPEVRLSVAGRERLFVPRASPLCVTNHPSEGFVLILEDVTDQRRGGEVHAGLLANAAADLERALAQLHPDGTPSAVREGLERLAQIAGNLRAMSRVEERRRQLHPESIAPAALVDAAVRGLAASFEGGRVELASDVDPAAPAVLADRERAGLVLSSLLQNALAHTPAGGVVTVKAEPRDGRTRFSVSDTGDGIPAASLEKIFEPFYQIPGTEDLGGVGLGLATARDIVQAHGGEIHAESAEGRGATFWFTLPAAVEHPPVSNRK